MKFVRNILSARVAPFSILFCMGVFVASCASIRDANILQQTLISTCNQQNVYSYSEDELPEPLHTMPIDDYLRNHLSDQSLNIANAIGALADITSYSRLVPYVSEATLEQRVRLLELKQRIDNRINMASLEVSAIASEMDCEEERTGQVANYLKNKEIETESRLTIGAIVIGATGAIAAGGIIQNDRASNAVGIATGVTEASLGLLMLFNNRKIDFFHERNALREVWEGKAVSSNFPPSVWYYLNYTDPSKEERSVREQIVDKWLNFGQISDKQDKKSDIGIYFGNGGRYTTEQLMNRADMYDQLESNITLMKQDLKALTLELESL